MPLQGCYVIMKIQWQPQIILARGVLSILVLIHMILPFTPINQHPELRIKIGSIVLGVLFLILALRSLTKPHSSLIFGFVLLIAVYFVSAMTGASPVNEGLGVKIVFAALLGLGIISTYKQKNGHSVS